MKKTNDLVSSSRHLRSLSLALTLVSGCLDFPMDLHPPRDRGDAGIGDAPPPDSGEPPADTGRGDVPLARGETRSEDAGLAPRNDTRAGATVIDLREASQKLSGDTTAARNDTHGACGCASGSDVFFRFTLAAPEMVYADTSGATWDTALFLQDERGANVTAAVGEVTCSDSRNRGDLCRDFQGRRSQILARLPAGAYYLVLSGCGAGQVDVHFQHLPAGNGTATRITPKPEEQTVQGTTSGEGSAVSPCDTRGPEDAWWWVTCSETPAQTFRVSSCDATTGANLADHDVAIVQHSALRASGAVCNDELGRRCDNGPPMTTTIPATESGQVGLNVLLADSWGRAGGRYVLRFSLATP